MLRFLRAHLGGLPSTYWYVWTGTLINRLGAFVVPFLALYLTEQVHLSATEAGTIAGLYGAGSLLAGLIGGAVADRYGRKQTLIFGLVVGGASMLGLGLAKAIPVVALMTFCVGFFTDLSRPAVSAIIADVVPPRDRARAYGLLHWAINIGFSVAPLVAGMVAGYSYLLLFAGDAATTLLYAGLVFARVPETRPAEVKAQPPSLRQLATPLTDGPFLAFALLAFLLGLVFFQFEVSLPLDIRSHGFGAETYGRLIAINGIMIVLLSPFAARAVTRFRRSHVMVAASLFTGVGFALPAFLHSKGAFAVSIMIWTMGEILNAPITPAVVADLAPAHLRGSYQGAMQVLWGLAFFTAPILGAAVLDRFGAPTLWLGCLGLSLAVAAGHLAIAAARRRRIAAIRTRTPTEVGLVED